MIRLLRLLRLFLPAALRQRVRLLLFRWLDLNRRQPSGLAIRLASYPDWVVFNEVFVDGQYDAAIRKALQDAPATRSLRVLDLGANLGFFTVRLLDLVEVEGNGSAGVEVTAVEANPYLIPALRSRLAPVHASRQRIEILHGAVGERSGQATLYLPAGHHTDGSLFPRAPGRTLQVMNLDLDLVSRSDEAIDLLKCDIEGAELLFIQNYPELLSKVRVAVLELHHDLCDTEHCRRLLRSCGFLHEQVIREGTLNSVHFVWR